MNKKVKPQTRFILLRRGNTVDTQVTLNPPGSYVLSDDAETKFLIFSQISISITVRGSSVEQLL